MTRVIGLLAIALPSGLLVGQAPVAQRASADVRAKIVPLPAPLVERTATRDTRIDPIATLRAE